MPNLHPPLTSFPLAFIVFLAVLELAYLLSARPAFRIAANFTLVAYVVGVFLAFFSGYQGLEFASTASENKMDLVSIHHAFGKLLMFLLAPLSAFGWLAPRAKQGQKLFWFFYYLSLVACLILTVYTGWLGGNLVFEHAVGVKT